VTDEQKQAMQQLCAMLGDLINTQPLSFRDALAAKAQQLIDVVSPEEKTEQKAEA